MAKVNQVWKELNAKMTAKRTRNPSGRNKNQKGTASELIVQRLTAEPDNKQTFRPVQPREFVEFEYDELTLDNLKQACATHFGLPVKTCDILVSNKGPSCKNINQIPHRKDKKEWVPEKPVTVFIDQEKFASGAFRDAYKGMPEGGASQKKWVIKNIMRKPGPQL
ncbi:Hypothetical predicted protein [Paramuricea clavata]|uniref:Uncharacterized protein n=1 Tax=Paramuricea clavata TaxID=317549 RepID=A0A6S7KA00_PARCT|nr:Hypothetical predicted protein [Paramuricea clavata]